MLRPLRQQASDALNALPVRRRPALRRSDAPDALLATDLPFAADEDAVATFVAGMERLGWRVWRAQNGWLLLDAPVPVPEAPALVRAEGACACCLSILQRHPQGGDASDAIRDVVKAAEAGRQPFERLCALLHERLAAMLRLHQPLPAALIPYLQRACHDLYERRNEP